MEDMEAPVNAVAIEVSQQSPKDPVMKETMRMVVFRQPPADVVEVRTHSVSHPKIEQLLGGILAFFFPKYYLQIFKE